MSEGAKLRAQVATLAKFGAQALRSADIDQLLQLATALVSDAMEVDLVKVLELLPDGENLLVRAGVNWSPGVVGHATISAERGSAAGYALTTDAPIISDVATETRFSIPELLIDHGVKSTVNVVIRGERGPFGVLEVDSRQERSFGDDDISFLQNYANLLSAAVDRIHTQRDLSDSLEKQKILLQELQHRVGNMLMTIRAVTRLTRAKSTNLDEFANALDSRLGALARSHALFAHADNGGTIHQILTHELRAEGATESESIVLRGDHVMLQPHQAQLMAMVFHELSTNAVKHGALSVPNGRIIVAWDIDQAPGEPRRVRLRWREHGVAIKSKPTRRGYGSEILEKSIPDMLHGSFDRQFHADGVECVIAFELE